MRYSIQLNCLVVLSCLTLSALPGVTTKAGLDRSDSPVIFHDRFEVDTEPAPSEPEETGDHISASLPGIVDNTVLSMESLAQSETLVAVTESFAVLSQLSALDGDDTEETTLVLQDNGDEEEQSPGEEFADFLGEVIFTEDHYEGDGYYRIPDELLCPTDGDGEPSEDCVEQIEPLEPRLRALLAGDDGLDIALSIGPDRIEPVTFELRPDSIAIVIDLGATNDLAEFLTFVMDGILEESTDETALLLAGLLELVIVDSPDVIEGVVSATIIVHDEEHVGLEAAVREAILIEDDNTRFSLAASDPALALEADGIKVSASADIDIGRLQYVAPWSEISPESNASGEYSLDWPGVSAGITLQDSTPMLQIDNIGLGDDTSNISLDDHVLVSIDLNAEEERSFALTVLPQDNEHPTVELDPLLDLLVGVDLQPLADAGDDVPSFMVDELYQLEITGSDPAIQTEAPQDDFPGGVRVVSGQLSLSNDTGDEVVVDEERCLIASEPEEDDHPLIGSYAESGCE